MAKMVSYFNAMGGGKTTILLQVCYNYEKNNHKVILIKPYVDTKGANKVSSRLNIERPVDILLKENESLLEKYYNTILNSKVIIVDESQFLTPEQVSELWAITKELDITVITYGLKTNFKGKLFLGSQAILEKADQIESLPVLPLCQCGHTAIFNGRKKNGIFIFDGEDIIIDGSDEEIEYESLCGECFYQEMRKQQIGITKKLKRIK